MNLYKKVMMSLLMSAVVAPASWSMDRVFYQGNPYASQQHYSNNCCYQPLYQAPLQQPVLHQPILTVKLNIIIENTPPHNKTTKNP